MCSYAVLQEPTRCATFLQLESESSACADATSRMRMLLLLVLFVDVTDGRLLRSVAQGKDTHAVRS